jgi:hypothetical protein
MLAGRRGRGVSRARKRVRDALDADGVGGRLEALVEQLLITG